MVTSPSVIAVLADALICGIAADPPWAAFLDRLREHTQADYASIVFRPLPVGSPQTRVLHYASGHQSPPIIAQLYRESLFRADPLPYFELIEGKTYRLDELLRDDDVGHELYRQSFVEPSGMNFLHIARVREAGGVNAWITISRKVSEFPTSAIAVLEAIIPLLRSALSSHLVLVREQTKASVSDDVVRRMNFGWMMLDATGRIVDADGQAEAILQRSGIIMRSRAGTLSASDPHIRQILTAALKEVAGMADARPRALVLNRDPWLDMLLVRSALADSPMGEAPSVICYVHADDASTADRCDQLCQIFDLVPCEARLALALCRGLTISEAAASLNLTTDSARTYTKRIYAKTGARGQTDLVRFILKSVAVIA